MKVYQAINKVQAALAVTGISKDRTNTQGSGYKFRGIDDVYNAVAPLLAEHGLCILPRVLTRVCEERTSKNGGALFYVTVEAEFDFVAAEDGEQAHRQDVWRGDGQRRQGHEQGDVSGLQIRGIPSVLNPD
jgi:hypothetical protein